MSDTRIFSMPDSGNSNAALIASLCQQRGLDPNMVAAMMNNYRGGNGGWGDGSAWWIIILLIFGWGGFGNGFGGGFGGRGSAQGLADLGNLVNNDAGRELLMSAIQGNGTAISQLASTVHCDVNALQGAIANVSQSICQLGNQMNMNTNSILTTMLQGNNALASQLAECCCENRLAICQQTNALQGAINFVNSSVERGFAATNFETERQTCAIKGAIADSTAQILAGQRSAEMREMQRELQALRDERTQYQMSALLQQQSQNLINTIRPCPVPSYPVCNPWGCQGNGYVYGFPYGENSGCGGC